jgi:hypothetical protein
MNQTETRQLREIAARHPGPAADALSRWLDEIEATALAAKLLSGELVAVSVSCNKGARVSVPMRIIGPFGVCRMPELPSCEDRVGWGITHVASGLRVASEVSTKRLVVAMATTLQTLPIPWDDSDPLSKAKPEVAMAARRIVCSMSAEAIEAVSEVAR